MTDRHRFRVKVAELMELREVKREAEDAIDKCVDDIHDLAKKLKVFPERGGSQELRCNDAVIRLTERTEFGRRVRKVEIFTLHELPRV